MTSPIRHRARVTSVGAAAVFYLCLTFSTTGLEGQEMTLVRAGDALGLSGNLVEVRAVDRIRDDLAASQEEVFRVEAALVRLEGALAEAKAAVEVKKNEIEITETERDLADKQDREAEKEALERQKDKQELEKDLLERRVNVAERRIDESKARRDYAEATSRVHEREITLESASAQLARLQGTEDGTLDQALRLRTEVRELEREVLEAMKSQAQREEELAKRRRRVIEAQIELLEARSKLQGAI